MKRIIVPLCLLFACANSPATPADATTDSSVIYDASAVHIDSASPADAPLATESGRNGCKMGNLPKSRTITVGAADAIPSAVIDELQDRDIAQSGQRDIFLNADAFCSVNLSNTVASSPAGNIGAGVWSMVSTGIVQANLFLPAGTVITDLRASFAGAVGATSTAAIYRRSFGDGGVTGGSVVTSVSPTGTGIANWLISATATGTPATIATGFYYVVNYSQTSGTGLFDGVKISVNGP